MRDNEGALSGASVMPLLLDVGDTDSARRSRVVQNRRALDDEQVDAVRSLRVGGAAARDEGQPGGRRPAGAGAPFELWRRADRQPRLRNSNVGRRHVGAELALGDGRGRIYIVE